jgi:O-acetyl-ADP-ribose deacetylase (regulator of RNase III)
MNRTKGAVKIRLVHGDITKIDAQCIVNAANSQLRAGKGVCGSIYKAAGLNELQAETSALGPVSTGSAVLSSSCDLEDYGIEGIIHAVGPIYQDGLHGEATLLASAYRNSLLLARDTGYKSIAFPCISTGVYGFPPALAAQIAIATVLEYLTQNPGLEVVFVAFEQRDYTLLEAWLKQSEGYLNLLTNAGFISSSSVAYGGVQAAPAPPVQQTAGGDDPYADL